MYNINNHIKNKTFKNIYILYGQESYLVRQFRKKLKDALMEDSDEMNLLVTDGIKNTDEIIDFADTIPFFGSRRVIVIDEGDEFLKGKESAKFLKYLPNAPETAFFIIVCKAEEVKGNIFNYVKKEGYVANFTRINESFMQNWVGSLLKSAGKSMTPEVYSYFINCTGNAMDTVYTELQKLISYMGERNEITRKDVAEITVKTPDSKIYEISNFIQGKNAKDALRIYNELLEEKNTPAEILGYIRNNFNDIYLVKQLREEGVGVDEITSNISKNSRAVNMLVKISQKFTSDELKKIINKCIDFEYDVKTGAIDQYVGLENLIISLCMGKNLQ